MKQTLPDLTLKQNFITPEEGELAIQYLMANIDPTILKSIDDYMYTEEWSLQFFFSIGLLVRNTLRQKLEWDDLLLDFQWAGLVEAATTRFMEALKKMTLFVVENIKKSHQRKLFTILGVDCLATPRSWLVLPVMVIAGIVLVFIFAPANPLLAQILVGVGYGFLIWYAKPFPSFSWRC